MRYGRKRVNASAFVFCSFAPTAKTLFAFEVELNLLRTSRATRLARIRPARANLNPKDSF